jgi:hypothetical protein
MHYVYYLRQTLMRRARTLSGLIRVFRPTTRMAKAARPEVPPTVQRDLDLAAREAENPEFRVNLAGCRAAPGSAAAAPVGVQSPDRQSMLV